MADIFVNNLAVETGGDGNGYGPGVAVGYRFTSIYNKGLNVKGSIGLFEGTAILSAFSTGLSQLPNSIYGGLGTGLTAITDSTPGSTTQSMLTCLRRRTMNSRTRESA